MKLGWIALGVLLFSSVIMVMFAGTHEETRECEFDNMRVLQSLCVYTVEDYPGIQLSAAIGLLMGSAMIIPYAMEYTMQLNKKKKVTKK